MVSGSITARLTLTCDLNSSTRDNDLLTLAARRPTHIHTRGENKTERQPWTPKRSIRLPFSLVASTLLSYICRSLHHHIMSTLADTSLPPSPNHADEDEEDLYGGGDGDDDEEDEDPRDPHAALVDHVRADNRNNREALAYLLRYETMVRQQEAEDMATLAHLRPCLERLNELLPAELQQHHPDTDPHKKADTDIVWTREISYQSLRKALEVLELQGPTEFMTTDRQLMMILRLLTQSDRETNALTWAELVQCYKTCIVGMTTLQHLPNADETRQRARDRTLAMLALFEPASRLWSASPLAPVRPMANTSALHRTQRSSFAPVARAAKRRRARMGWMAMAAAALLLLLLAAAAMTGGYYYTTERNPAAVVSSLWTPPSPAASGPASQKQRVRNSKPAPTFAVRTMVPTSMATSSSALPKGEPVLSDYQYSSSSQNPSQYEMGVTGPALVVATLGTPVMVVAVQTLLQQMGSGAAFVAATTSLATVGNFIVTAAGFLSLTSLFYANLRAIVRGLRRLGRSGDEDEQ